LFKQNIFNKKFKQLNKQEK